MKKIITGLFIGFLVIYFFRLPVSATEQIGELTHEVGTEQATEITEVNEAMNGKTVQKDRTYIEGFLLPDEVDHTVTQLDSNTLHLIESLSINGATDEFYLNVDNTSQCNIPYNYINMFNRNVTPFTIHLYEDNSKVAQIFTNGVLLNNGEFPLHVHIAEGVDFMQISFDCESSDMEGHFMISIPCTFDGHHYDVYEGNNIVQSNVLSGTSLVLYLDNFNTKTIKFYEDEPIIEDAEKESIVAEELATQTDTDSEQESPNLAKRFIIIIVLIVVLAVILVGTITVIRKRVH